MLYRNASPHALDFTINSLRFQLPPGGECDIPPNLAYVVASRGLPLERGSAGGEHVEATLVRQARRAMEPGVTTGTTEPREDDDLDDADEDVPEAPSVTDAIEKLRAEGALPPGGKKKGR